jgi:hypothetical protein
MGLARRSRNWISINWERGLFAVFGFGFFFKCFQLIYANKITEGAVVFGLGFLCFIFANVARFKKFKGLGFEAELWADKQKEAADLIERLRDVVSIYTREVILGKVNAGRWGRNTKWHNHWKLYDDLVRQHKELGQAIDFSGLKKEIDDYFLFDMTMPAIAIIQQSVYQGRSLATEAINKEFGNPIRDVKGYNQKLEKLRDIQFEYRDGFTISSNEDLAKHALNAWGEANRLLKQNFNIDIDINPEARSRLELISKIYQHRPVKITDELIKWADKDE